MQSAPEGLCRWTLNLIADKFISLNDMEVVSTETIRRRFKENDLKPWQKKMWCVGKMNADYVAQMEHILDLYAVLTTSRIASDTVNDFSALLKCDSSEPGR